MRRAIFRSTALAIGATVAIASTVLAVTTAQAGAVSISLSKATTDVAPDFASQRYADQWDYANVEDLSLLPLFNGSGNSQMSYPGDGSVHATVSRGGWLNLVNATPGSIPYGRDGRAISIDSGQYKRFSIRMWSDRDNIAQVWWRTCAEADTACYGALQFETKAGWGTYDVALQKISQTAANWSGPIVAMQINPTGIADGRVAIDWTRVYQPIAGNQISVGRSDGNGSGELVIDLDNNPNNGTETVLRRDGSTVQVGANGSATLDSSLLPAGRWYIGVKSLVSGNIAYAGSALTVNSTPMPVVLDPDLAGGADVHEIQGGSAWDFNELSDITGFGSVQNANLSGGVLYGQNGRPNNWDPQVNLAMPGLIDGSRFHRVTMKIGYDGVWGLQDAPGGGMMTRLVWQTNGNPAAYQDLDDVVVLPGDQTITFDLATNPSTAIVDGDNTNKIGWAGQQISSLRFDPNEDPSLARTWRIDDIRLAQDDQGNGSFNVRFKDANWAPGTVADVYVDRGAPGQNRTLVASGVGVAQGVNTVSWALNGMPEGTYWVLVAMRRGGVSSSAFSTGPVQMKGSAASVPQARGNFDSVRQVGVDGVQFRGWALDPANSGSTAAVHLYVDGKGAAITANASRPDVAAALGVGRNHGFDYTMKGIGVGDHRTCAYVFRAGGSSPLGCRTIRVSGDPIGNVESVVAINGGVAVSGWALDRSTGTSIGVHAYVDGRLAATTTAAGNRPDVAAVYPAYGPAHGFSMGVPVPAGNHTLCLYGIDQAPPGGNALLYCQALSLPAAPFGYLDRVRRSGTTLSVQGWAIDPRSLGATGIHVYVDGVGRAVLNTSTQRPDVLAALPYRNSSQGFAASIQVSDAPHRVCVYGVGVQASALIGCTNV